MVPEGDVGEAGPEIKALILDKNTEELRKNHGKSWLIVVNYV